MRMPAGRARDRFAAARVARLATVNAQGVPRLVPVTFAVGGDTVVTAVDHKPKETTDLRRLRDISENPQVCLMVDHYEDDWERLWWARADGWARIAESGGERERAVEWLVEKYAQYREHPPEGPAILIEVTHWSGWSYAPLP
ncbi:TIGR03668 family PPOX class F420-dependent oxidoreductase [Planotetraspora sp. A-T 1434]|uniref:TIGR03668 family PPOX class F420-dependent oxidoreductase n=1 Tax=Planotetraspora sp. A-T 1434 TaxID=2979219 RepID=UPI0021C0D57D|nr:TIGR03668 family PPOX class F420-dependent oxidoreductase [Planotetraspora sp. A-T 1434]MCT9929716.1 TIGR03668 family PPOX class F420-dependent oxidoreductase [Planotetraspora sp. A-T 1434]